MQWYFFVSARTFHSCCLLGRRSIRFCYVSLFFTLIFNFNLLTRSILDGSYMNSSGLRVVARPQVALESVKIVKMKLHSIKMWNDREKCWETVVVPIEDSPSSTLGMPHYSQLGWVLSYFIFFCVVKVDDSGDYWKIEGEHHTRSEDALQPAPGLAAVTTLMFVKQQQKRASREFTLWGKIWKFFNRSHF